MAAMLSWSLGEINPGPPRTFRGTIMIEEAATPVLIKLRLDSCFFGFIFLIVDFCY
jgi:hypothetical protein